MAHFFSFPPRLSKWIKSMKGYNVIFKRADQRAIVAYHWSRSNPVGGTIGAFAIAGGIAYWVLKEPDQPDKLQPNEIFAHPKNRNLRDAWGHREISTPPFFKPLRNLEAWYFMDELRKFDEDKTEQI